MYFALFDTLFIFIGDLFVNYGKIRLQASLVTLPFIDL